MIPLGAATRVDSTPVGLLALLGVIASVAGFLGAVVTIKKVVVDPIRRGVEFVTGKLDELAEVGEAVRDLTATLTHFIGDCESRFRANEQRLERLERLDLTRQERHP